MPQARPPIEAKYQMYFMLSNNPIATPAATSKYRHATKYAADRTPTSSAFTSFSFIAPQSHRTAKRVAHSVPEEAGRYAMFGATRHQTETNSDQHGTGMVVQKNRRSRRHSWVQLQVLFQRFSRASPQSQLGAGTPTVGTETMAQGVAGTIRSANAKPMAACAAVRAGSG